MKWRVRCEGVARHVGHYVDFVLVLVQDFLRLRQILAKPKVLQKTRVIVTTDALEVTRCSCCPLPRMDCERLCLERFHNMLATYRLLALFITHFVRFRRDKVNELCTCRL